MKIITWNCNGIRARFPLIKKLINSLPIDILCLQETKISDDIFPVKEFQQFGFMFQAYRGEKGYNGVAILSKLPFKSSDSIFFENNPFPPTSESLLFCT